jgi:hypothetical protein
VANTVTAVADKRRAPPGDKRDGLTPDQGPGLAPKKVTVNRVASALVRVAPPELLLPMLTRNHPALKHD